jgi:hypothetical protein
MYVLKESLEALKKLQQERQGKPGARETALAVTNLEQAMLWLQRADALADQK